MDIRSIIAPTNLDRVALEEFAEALTDRAPEIESNGSSRKEVAVANSIAERIHVNSSACIAWECVAVSVHPETREPQFECRAVVGRLVGLHGGFLGGVDVFCSAHVPT